MAAASTLPDIERVFLTECVANSQFFDRYARNIKPDFFAFSVAGAIFQEVVSIRAVANAVNVSVLTTRVTTGADYNEKVTLTTTLDAITGNTALHDASQWAALEPTLKDYWTNRAVYTAMGTIVSPVMKRADGQTVDDNGKPLLTLEEIKTIFNSGLEFQFTGTANTFLTIDDVMKRPDAMWLVEDMLLDKTRISITAQAGLYKSFAALDLAMTVALPDQSQNLQADDKDWCGHKVWLHGPVVYVLGEGVDGWKWRIRAWETEYAKQYGTPARNRLMTRDRAIALYDDASVSDFIKEVEAHFPTDKPVLIVFDTFSRMMAGVDENATNVMTAAVKNVDRIRDHFGCAIVMCHHTTKNGEKERGNSSYRGALDHQLFMEFAGKRRVKLRTDKAKDAAGADDILLEAKTIQMAEKHPQTGKPWSSLVLKVMPPEAVDSMNAEEDKAKEAEDEKRLAKVQRHLEKFPKASKNDLIKAMGKGIQRARAGRLIDRWETNADIITDYRKPFQKPEDKASK